MGDPGVYDKKLGLRASSIQTNRAISLSFWLVQNLSYDFEPILDKARTKVGKILEASLR